MGEDSQRIKTKNKEYLVGLSFGGIIEAKQTRKVGETTDYRLKIHLVAIDSVPSIANREYYYFSFQDEKTLEISVNEKIYAAVIVNDTVSKNKMGHTLFLKNNSTPIQLKWLSEGNEWLADNPSQHQ